MSETDGVSLRVDSADVIVVVTVAGEIDLATVAPLEQTLVQWADGDRPVVVDLSSVAYVDSSGFRVLHGAAQRAPVALVVPEGSPIARAVGLAGLGRLIGVHPDAEAAKAALRAP